MLKLRGDAGAAFIYTPRQQAWSRKRKAVGDRWLPNRQAVALLSTSVRNFVSGGHQLFRLWRGSRSLNLAALVETGHGWLERIGQPFTRNNLHVKQSRAGEDGAEMIVRHTHIGRPSLFGEERQRRNYRYQSGLVSIGSQVSSFFCASTCVWSN